VAGRIPEYARLMNGVEESPSAVDEGDLATIRRGYELWNAGDIAGLSAACFTDDIEYRTNPNWPGQHVYHGREAVERFLREEVAELIALTDIRIERIEPVGGELVITLRARTHGAASGIDVPSGTIFHVARLRAGRVDRVRVFLDEEEATAAAKGG
jgi:ketosteroid isomerase-like protein